MTSRGGWYFESALLSKGEAGATPRQQRHAKTSLSRLHLHLPSLGTYSQAKSCLRLVFTFTESPSEDVGGLHFAKVTAKRHGRSRMGMLQTNEEISLTSQDLT